MTKKSPIKNPTNNSQNDKPRVFIGSSSEALTVARVLQSQLEDSCQVTIWNQGVFGVGIPILESLIKQTKRTDFAILVLTPDDKIITRGTGYPAARDNVIFELGLFCGSVGTNRTYI